MKYLILLVLVSFTFGCASTSVVRVGSPPVGGSVFLTSKCDSICQRLIASKYSIEGMNTLLLGKDKPVNKYVILSKVNGHSGQGIHYDPFGAFNTSWDGSFKVEAQAGNVEVTILPSSRNNAPNEELTLNFGTIAGHEYFVGSMGWREMQGVQINNWHPIILDLSTGKIIYPEAHPQWRKYCTLNQEWAGNTPCP